MGRKVLILHLPQLEGWRYSSKEGELVGCFKRKLTHFLADLKFPTTATLGPGLGGLVPFPVTPLPPQTLKEHARGFQLSRSARVSCLQQFSQARRAQRLPPFPLPLCDAASWRSLSPGERHHSAGAPATGPCTWPPRTLLPLLSPSSFLGATGKPGSTSPVFSLGASGRNSRPARRQRPSLRASARRGGS